jgi:hypothetical protein
MTFKQRVEKFWDWFRQHAARFHQTIEHGQSPTLAPEVSAKINEVLPGFAWVFGPGKNSSEHSFTLSPEGILAKQFLSDFWLSLALSLPGWTFHSSRQPSQVTSTIRIGEDSFEANALWVVPKPNEEKRCLDLTLWHPNFAKLEEQARFQLTFLWLDGVLGEHGTASWIGTLEFSDQSFKEAVPITELPQLLEKTKTEFGWKKEAIGNAFTLYKQQPKPGHFLRDDVITGVTRFPDLIHAFLSAKGKMKDPVADLGADCIFVTFPANILPKGQEAAVRDELEDLLTETLEREKLGTVLGGALGTRLAYIDLMFFDGSRSLKTAASTIASHPLRPKAEFYHFVGAKRTRF